MEIPSFGYLANTGSLLYHLKLHQYMYWILRSLLVLFAEFFLDVIGSLVDKKMYEIM